MAVSADEAAYQHRRHDLYADGLTKFVDGFLELSDVGKFGSHPEAIRAEDLCRFRNFLIEQRPKWERCKAEMVAASQRMHEIETELRQRPAPVNHEIDDTSTGCLAVLVGASLVGIAVGATSR